MKWADERQEETKRFVKRAAAAAVAAAVEQQVKRTLGKCALNAEYSGVCLLVRVQSEL